MTRQKFTVLVDDTDIDFFGMKLVDYEIQSYAKRKSVGTDIPGAHGTQEVPSALASGTFVVNVVCQGSDPDDVSTKIREFFAFMYSTSRPRKIVFSDNLSIVRNAILDSPERYRVVNGIDNAFAQLKLTFFMLDPFMYDERVSRFTTVAEHGVPVSLYNEAFECPAVYSLTNSGSHAVSGVSLIVNNELSSFSCELAPGDVLELDTVEYEVRLNGIVHLEYWRGEMPKLKNGVNSIYQQNTLRDNLDLLVTFTKQWI